MNKWMLFIASVVPILAVIISLQHKQTKKIERWQQWVGVSIVVCALLLALDVVFGWTHQIEPFELRLSILSARTGLGAVFVIAVIALTLYSRRKQQ